MKNEKFDVVIVGAGVTGSSLFWMYQFTNVSSVALIERRSAVGQVNSSRSSNSQTVHFGDTEPNYDRASAAKVKEAAELLMKFVLKKPAKGFWYRRSRMLLAVGASEIAELTHRLAEIRDLYPSLQLIGREGIARLEPNVVLGRDPKEPIMALYNPNGFAVNYERLCEYFVAEARNDERTRVVFNREVLGITKNGDGYRLITNDGDIEAQCVVFASGAESLVFAHRLGLGHNYAILPVAGNFVETGHAVNGKVYTMQIKEERVPFAAVHADAEVTNPKITRFGPTALPMVLFERGNWKSFWRFSEVFRRDLWGNIYCTLTILSEWKILRYIIKNLFYLIPFVGMRLYLREMRKIVPLIKAKDLRFVKGGVRPQIIDREEMKLEMGVGEVTGDRVICNITPSPGATKALQNAREDVPKSLTMLGLEYYFDEEKFHAYFNS